MGALKVEQQHKVFALGDMALDFNSSSLEPCSRDQNVVFDAESVALLGKFNDELSAYRTRKKWVDVLSSYFLLERDRDYELEIKFLDEEEHFILSCTFISACGRYAFWRLINHQAPEAEQKLSPNGRARSLSGKRTQKRDGISTSELPWVLTGMGPKPRKPSLIVSLLGRINKVLQ